LVVAATSTYGYFNSQMDVTQAVITKLNAKLTSLNFDLVVPPAQTAAAAPTGPAPAAAATHKKK
jgi:hypothetical protein